MREYYGVDLRDAPASDPAMCETPFNDMPIVYREKLDTHSLDGFKKYIKNCIVASYVAECNIDYCYICSHIDNI